MFRLHRWVSIPALVVAVVVLVVTAPVVVAAAFIVDLIDRRRFRWLRLWAIVVSIALVELGGLIAGGVLWVAAGFGTQFHREWSQRAHRRLEEWWVARLMSVLRVAAGLRLGVTGMDALTTGNAVVIARHTSLGDSFLPAWLCANQAHLHLRYVLKKSLSWAPCMDVVGHRLPNHFVDRSPDDDRELHALADLAAGIDERSVAVIFPEGTFHTPERATRIVERLRETRPEVADRAARLRHLLPPRPGGTFALLDGAPLADVVVIRHVGFEQFSSIPRIMASIPFDEPVTVDLYRIPRAEVPSHDEERLEWLYRVWEDIDNWCTTMATSSRRLT